jgi:hypothetical protein
MKAKMVSGKKLELRDAQTPGLSSHAGWFRAIAALAALIALVRAGSTIGTFNDCVDEPYNVGSAIALYGTGKLVAGSEQPPLPRIVAGLPLWLSGVRLPEKYHSTRVLSELQTYHEGDDLLFNSSISYEQILWRCRLTMLIFPASALLYLYLLAKWASGDLAAMLAVLFFSTDPTFLGHSFWICTDAAACAGFLAATYHGLRWIASPSMGKAIAAATVAALAISCKFSCSFVVPALMLAMVIRPIPILLRGENEKWRKYFRAWPSIGQIAVAAAVGFFVLWGTYLFNVGPLADQSAFAAQKEWQELPAWVKNTPIPMPSLPLGILRLLGHNRFGSPAYLNGQISTHGWWYYFPEAIAVKSPVALLAGIVMAMVMRLIGFRKINIWSSAGLVLAPAVFMAAAMKGNLDIGIRHVLPVIPFLYLFVCAQLARGRFVIVAIFLIAVSFIETSVVHPEYVSFFNFAVGGPSHGDKFLLDSNLDWGQDIAQLANWMHLDEMREKSYSTRLFLNPVNLLENHLGLNPEAQNEKPIGYFIISENILHGVLPPSWDDMTGRDQPQNFDWVKKYPIVKHIGYSIMVYNLGVGSVAKSRSAPQDVFSAAPVVNAQADRK